MSAYRDWLDQLANQKTTTPKSRWITPTSLFAIVAIIGLVYWWRA